ncbi:MAG: carbon monoxide dehydrogenase [Deltaproteobacteria bacterium HGW-Deltaproteobacteria-14]|jgi:CO/xanthine dehydrogenase FAD-binding subunit|nr:MAG: carbon monoxide dehydrogenase [Deltaproteobacteria bacterium HGW-Deltaproteobacteria-14]
MRANVPQYDVVAPPTLAEALALMAREPGVWTPLAGGTDLMVLFEAGKLPPGRYLSIWGLPELAGIQVTADAVTLGALTTYGEIRANATVQADLPMLVRAARETGAIAIQNRGTIGGNIANASPAADSPPALVAYDAALTLISAAGTRTTAFRGFHTGYKRMDLRPGELVQSVRVLRRPAADGWVHFYKKVGTRAFQAISKVGFAGCAQVVDGVAREVRIGLASVAPTVLVAAHTEAALEGARVADPGLEARAAQAMVRDVTAIDDIRSTARYRSQVAANLAAAFVRALRERG